MKGGEMYVSQIRKAALLLPLLIMLAVLACEQPNNPPAIPATPVPIQGTSITTSHVTLKWSGGDTDPEQVFYDIYFGKASPPPLLEAGLVEKSYEISNLESGTTYYWKIVAQDARGDTSLGPIWSFSTTGGDPYEPNNWFDEAYGPIDFGKKYQALVTDPHDGDCFYFFPKNNGMLDARLFDLPADYDLFLFDASENILACSQNGKLQDENINCYLTAWKKYYIMVSPCASCNTETPYSLELSLDTTTIEDSYEPNNYFDQAWGPMEFGKEYESWIWNYDDSYDFYYITPSQYGELAIHLYSLPSNYDLYLYSDNDWYYPLAGSENDGTNDEWIYYYVNSGEKYYALVYSGYGTPDSSNSYLLEVAFDSFYVKGQNKPGTKRWLTVTD